jgi:hypothetical protein
VPLDQKPSILGIAEDFSVIRIRLELSPNPSLALESVTQLPLPRPPVFIVPVDQMAWSGPLQTNLQEHDVLLSVTEDGELAFWVPEDETWRCTGKVNTGRRGLRRVSCSSAKKTVLGLFYLTPLRLLYDQAIAVAPTPDGEELTIWDSKESEFASGLEYRGVFRHVFHHMVVVEPR